MGNDYTSGYCRSVHQSNQKAIDYANQLAHYEAPKMEIDVRKKYITEHGHPVKFLGGINEPNNDLIYGVYRSHSCWRPSAWHKNGNHIDAIPEFKLKEVFADRTHVVYFTFFSDGTYTSRPEISYAIPPGCSVVGRQTITFTVTEPGPGSVKTKVG